MDEDNYEHAYLSQLFQSQPEEPASPERQAALAHFASVAKSMLCLGFRQSELASTLRSVVVEACKGLPPARVLYCPSFGGYAGYSKAFVDFVYGLLDGSEAPDGEQPLAVRPSVIPSLATLCAAQRVRDERMRSRLTDLHLVQSFGQHLFQQYPCIARLAYAYTAGVGQALGHTDHYKEAHRKLDVTRTRLQQLEALISAPGAEEDWSQLKSCIHYAYDWTDRRVPSYMQKSQVAIDFAPYAQQARQEIRLYLQETLAIHSAAFGAAHGALMANLLPACGGDQGSADELVASLHEQLPQGLPGEKQQSWGRPTFTKAIKKYGEQHWAIWRCQSQFEAEPMECLIKRPAVLDKLLSGGMADAQLLGQCYELLGLAGASGCGSLAIKEVPQLAEWRISRHDETEAESVVLV